MNEQASGRNRGSFTQHRLSLKGCSPAEPLYVSPDATKIIDGLEIQLSKSSFLSNEWGVLYIKITSKRVLKEKTESETRYYISSLNLNAIDFNKYIRMHWGVENSLHWTLDMVFNEDYQRKRNGRSAENFALIQKMALNILRKDQSKGSLKSKRLRAGWDNKFLLDIIKI